MDEFGVGQLAQELFTGYLAYAAGTTMMRHPYIEAALERIEQENPGPAPVPVDSVRRLDGSAHYFSLIDTVRRVGATSGYRARHDQAWLAGALVTLGDELSRAEYFDKRPDLEFIRHIRNGIAHGNRFHFRKGEPRRPARFTGPPGRFMPDRSTSPPGDAYVFEILASLQGQPILFDFVGPGDVLDVLQFVSWRLIRIGNGDPPHDLWPQS